MGVNRGSIQCVRIGVKGSEGMPTNSHSHGGTPCGDGLEGSGCLHESASQPQRFSKSLCLAEEGSRSGSVRCTGNPW